MNKLSLYKQYESYFKSLNKLAVPILITYLNSMVFALGDEMIVTRTGQDYYSIASLITMYIYYITGAVSCISLVINILGGKEAKEKTEDYKRLLSTCFAFIFIVSLCTFIINVSFGYTVLNKYYHFEGDVLKQGYIYLIIQSVTTIVYGFVFVFSAHFRNTQNMKIVVKTVLKSNIINITIDVILVFGLLGMPKLGIVGAGVGTFIGCVYTVIVYTNYFRKDITLKVKIYKDKLKEIWEQFVPLYMQEILEYTIIYMFLSYIIASISTASVGIFNFYTSILNLALLPAFAYGSSLLTLTTQNADDIKPIKKVSSFIMIVYWLVISFVFITFGEKIFYIITGNVQFSRDIYNYAFVVFIFFGFNLLQTLMKYNVQGLKLTKYSYILSLMTNTIICLVLFIMLKMNVLNLYKVYIIIGIGNIVLFVLYDNVDKVKKLFPKLNIKSN